MTVDTSPATIAANLAAILEILPRVRAEYPDAHDYAHAAGAGESTGKISRGIVRPTEAIFAAKGAERAMLRSAARAIESSRKRLEKAEELLSEIYGRASTPAPGPLAPAGVSKQELRDSVAAARRRRARGEGMTGEGQIGIPEHEREAR